MKKEGCAPVLSIRRAYIYVTLRRMGIVADERRGGEDV